MRLFERLHAHAASPLGRWWLAAALILMVGDTAYHVFVSNGEPPPVGGESLGPPAPEKTSVTLTPEQSMAAGIVVESITPKPFSEVFRAPGEVHVNDYLASNVGVRVAATIIERHAKLGDRVTRGQSVVTLYSSDMAAAQSAYVLASKNFVRVSRLKGIVSGQDFDEAEVKREEARGRLETYGLSRPEIAELAENGLTRRPAGQFDLSAPQDGVITTDDFRSGQQIEPGRTLFEIANLSSVWVEAQVSPSLAPRITGPRAHVIAADREYEGRIVQTHEQLNETTRTLGVRLQLENPSGALKPGQFVDVELFAAAKPELVVPTAAALRDAEDNWVVYIANAEGAFEPARVEVLYSVDNQTVITGIPEGTRVVTVGAFFVKSEAEKSRFAGE